MYDYDPKQFYAFGITKQNSLVLIMMQNQFYDYQVNQKALLSLATAMAWPFRWG